ncbi:MAG TPA: hypothetical protein VLF16_00195 [Pseudomonas sp.]|nr:hypothetical protein [Pseudomonas sp.]
MSLREWLGLALLMAALASMPFAGWLSRDWLFVTLALVCVGGPLFFISRRRRRIDRTENGDAERLPVLGEARGFAGHRAFDDGADD